jgi:hypothetical protein
MDALGLLARWAEVDGKQRFYDPSERVPLDGVVPKAWREAWSTRRAGSSAFPLSTPHWVDQIGTAWLR